MPSNNERILENEIRPVNLMEKQRKAMAVDIERLKSKRKNFVVVNCPACNSRNYKDKFVKYGMKFVECLECETFFTNPRPTPNILAWLYKYSANYDYWDKYIFPVSENIRREKIVIPRVNLISDICSKFNIKKDSLLEVGAGHGTFCEAILSKKIFKRVVAVEPVVSQAKTCIERGIETINLPIERVKFKRNEFFSAIVNFEVMEHLFSPAKFIISCSNLLKRGGLFIFTLPNGKGFDVSLLGKLSSVVDHEHLNYFNPRSIELLLNRCGLQTVQIITPGKLDAELVRNMIISRKYKISGDSFLKSVLIDNWNKCGSSFQTFLANAGLSSHMLVVARKV